MDVDVAKSKKRARRDNSQGDATMTAPPSKKSKSGQKSSSKGKNPMQTPVSISTLKPQYDGAFPADAVVGQDMPVYIMAKNYINLYGTRLPAILFNAC